MENRNICPQPMSDSEFRRRITKLLLGDDWFVTLSISQEQVNTCAYDEIKRKYKHKTLKSYYRFLKQKVLTILR